MLKVNNKDTKNDVNGVIALFVFVFMIFRDDF